MQYHSATMSDADALLRTTPAFRTLSGPDRETVARVASIRREPWERMPSVDSPKPGHRADYHLACAELTPLALLKDDST